MNDKTVTALLTGFRTAVLPEQDSVVMGLVCIDFRTNEEISLPLVAVHRQHAAELIGQLHDTIARLNAVQSEPSETIQ